MGGDRLVARVPHTHLVPDHLPQRRPGGDQARLHGRREAPANQLAGAPRRPQGHPGVGTGPRLRGSRLLVETDNNHGRVQLGIEDPV